MHLCKPCGAELNSSVRCDRTGTKSLGCQVSEPRLTMPLFVAIIVLVRLFVLEALGKLRGEVLCGLVTDRHGYLCKRLSRTWPSGVFSRELGDRGGMSENRLLRLGTPYINRCNSPRARRYTLPCPFGAHIAPFFCCTM
ncbi:hypothetical protein CC79DRAFT_580904 [Sarocladium strictum]